MNNEIIILVISFLILTGMIIFLLIKIKAYRKTLNRILDHMDLAISGTEQEIEYDENIDAAITEKMNKLVNISRLNYEDASRDRDLVKSLISDIAHQVRTPLTNIMLYAGLLQENAITDDSIKMAKQIQRQSEKLDFFMNELVKSSYMETEMIAVHREENSIDELFAEACQEVELAALKKKIIFNIKECDRSGSFDMKWTKEVLINLLDNAIKYSPEESEILLNYKKYESFFSINIIDHGMGISESEQGMIFKRFYRSPEVEREQGLGIGLYLVREIIEKQGGYIKVRSEVGKGSTFSMFLPN